MPANGPAHSTSMLPGLTPSWASRAPTGGLGAYPKLGPGSKVEAGALGLPQHQQRHRHPAGLEAVAVQWVGNCLVMEVVEEG